MSGIWIFQLSGLLNMTLTLLPDSRLLDSVLSNLYLFRFPSHSATAVMTGAFDHRTF